MPSWRADTRMPADFVGLLSHLGLNYIKERGDEVWASCPSHHDSGDSWSINRISGLHRCFSCGFSGNLQGLVIDTLRVDNFVANRLIRSFGLAETLDSDKLYALRDAEPVIGVRQPVAPEVKYRGFEDVPDKMLRDRDIARESADHFGIRWDPRREAWALPLRTPGGKFLGYQEKGRGGVRTLPPGVVKSVTLFGAEHLVLCDRIVLVESPLDVAVLHTRGTTAVASFGAGVSDEQMRLIKQYADHVVLALDNDAAGIENTARLLSGHSYNQQGRQIDNVNWFLRMPMSVIRYGLKSPKDVGAMTMWQSTAALADTIEPFTWLKGIERINEDVHRSAERIPRGGHRSDGRHRGDSGRVQHGAGQDRRDDRRGRAAH